MTVTRLIGRTSGKIINLIVGALALSRIHPNVLTFLGLVIIPGRPFSSRGPVSGSRPGGDSGRRIRHGGRPVARETNRVTRFGGFSIR